MPVQDLLKKQIDQLGKLLNKILEDLILPADNVSHQIVLDAAGASLHAAEEPGLNQLMNLSPEEIAQIWISRDSKTHENLEKLADIYAALSESVTDAQVKESYSLKALSLYEYITSKTATFSFERNAKIQRLKTTSE